MFVAAKLLYGVKLNKRKKKDARQLLIVSNHQTVFDDFFVGLSFSGPVYYVASEDMFSIGILSKLLSWAVGPIPFKKSTNDVGAVMNCMRIAHEGGSICIFPEGNRTYHGRTVAMKDSIAVLAKKMKLPLAIFKIDGGYGIKPRWSDKRRKGKMTAGVTRIIEPEELAKMTEEEIYRLISKELYVDEHKKTEEYPSRHLAEYLERAIYVCPDCGLSAFISKGRRISCQKCGKITEYLPNKTLKGINYDCRMKNEGEWYDYQENYIRRLSRDAYLTEPAYVENVSILRVIPYKKKLMLDKEAVIRLYSDRYEFSVGAGATADFAENSCFDGIALPFSKVQAAAAVGRNKLNIYTSEGIYQIKADKHFNPLKYVNFYYHYIGNGENSDAEFLGL